MNNDDNIPPEIADFLHDIETPLLTIRLITNRIDDCFTQQLTADNSVSVSEFQTSTTDIIREQLNDIKQLSEDFWDSIDQYYHPRDNHEDTEQALLTGGNAK